MIKFFYHDLISLNTLCNVYTRNTQSTLFPNLNCSYVITTINI